MGLIGLLTGWDQYKASNNAVLANHLLARLDRQQKKDIATLIADQILNCRYRGTAEDVLHQLNDKCRVTQMNFIALACNDLGIEPPIPQVYWEPIRNPYVMGEYTKKRDIAAAVRWFARKNGVSIKWPGDDVKVDFLEWYNGETGAKPKRGENLTATATVPLETAELGGSTRVVMPNGRAFDVTIPAGVEEGTQVRMRGQGQPGPVGGEPGDVLITIKITPAG